MRKIGINYEQMPGWEVEDYIKKSSELGFQTFFSSETTMEMHVRIANALAKYGMEYETVHAPFKNINDIWFEGEAGEVVYQRFVDCLDQCAEAKAGIMIVHLSSGLKPPTITEIGQTRFKKIVDYAVQKNIKVAFENQRKLANLAWALETFDDTEMVGFCWDCGHEACFTPGREYMPIFGSKLICTHIHDNEGEYNKDSHLIPFDGAIDFERFAEHIRVSGYTGPLTLEVIAKNSNRYNDISNEEYLEKSAIAIKRLVKMVGGI